MRTRTGCMGTSLLAGWLVLAGVAGASSSGGGGSSGAGGIDMGSAPIPLEGKEMMAAWRDAYQRGLLAPKDLCDVQRLLTAAAGTDARAKAEIPTGIDQAAARQVLAVLLVEQHVDCP
jgi:hypothetical protein